MRVVIDGNIGSGKTTQLGLLEQLGFTVKRESIHEWPLEKFYQDPSRWSLLMHLAVLKTMEHPDGVVCERCPLSTMHVFWKHNVDKGLVTPEEDRIFQYYAEKHAWKPDMYIYISKSPELCWEHIQKRQQDGDSGVTLEYLKELDMYYKRLLGNVPCRVYVVNGTKDPGEIHREILEYFKKVENGPSAKRQCTDMCCVS